MTERRSLSRGRIVAFSAIVAVGALGAAEAILQLRAWEQYGANLGSVISSYDAELGWAPIPDTSFENGFADGARSTHNEQRIRDTRDLPLQKSGYRVVALGDSFTYGHCDDAHTWPARLEAHAPLETINLGAGGYGVGQMWLSWRHRGRQFGPDLVLLTVIDQDFQRMERSFTPWSKTQKPRVGLDANDQLVIENQPVPEFGGVSRSVGDWLAHLPRSLAFVQILAERREMAAVAEYRYQDVTKAILQDLQRDTAATGADLALVYLPTGDNLLPEPQFSTDRQWLQALSEELGLTYIDLLPAFDDWSQERRQALFIDDSYGNHYDKRGNDVIAGMLADRLRAAFDRFPSPPSE